MTTEKERSTVLNFLINVASLALLLLGCLKLATKIYARQTTKFLYRTHIKIYNINQTEKCRERHEVGSHTRNTGSGETWISYFRTKREKKKSRTNWKVYRHSWSHTRARRIKGCGRASGDVFFIRPLPFARNTFMRSVVWNIGIYSRVVYSITRRAIWPASTRTLAVLQMQETFKYSSRLIFGSRFIQVCPFCSIEPTIS